MAKLTRREAEERRAGLRAWFLNHPDATGDEANTALEDGRVTGRKGPGMSLHTIHAIQREARAMAAGRVPSVPAATPPGDLVEGPARKRVRELVEKLQAALADLPDVESVVVSKTGYVARRVTVQEGTL